MADPPGLLEVLIAVSGRHVHLSEVHRDALFGAGHTLACKHPVTQPGQFACVDAVEVIDPRGAPDRVAIVAPQRAETQVELSRSDAIHLGVDPPVRESGHPASSPGVTLRGPPGTVRLDHGAIVALPHLHATPEDAQRLGVQNGERIAVKVGGPRAVRRPRFTEDADLWFDTSGEHRVRVVSQRVSW